MFEETPLHVFLKTLPPQKKGVPFGGGGEGGRARPGVDGKFLTPGCARNGPRGAGGSGEPAPQAGHAPRWGPGRGPDVSNFLPPLGASRLNGLNPANNLSQIRARHSECLDNPSAVFARRHAVFFGIPDRNDEAASGVLVWGDSTAAMFAPRLCIGQSQLAPGRCETHHQAGRR